MVHIRNLHHSHISSSHYVTTPYSSTGWLGISSSWIQSWGGPIKEIRVSLQMWHVFCIQLVLHLWQCICSWFEWMKKSSEHAGHTIWVNLFMQKKHSASIPLEKSIESIFLDEWIYLKIVYTHLSAGNEDRLSGSSERSICCIADGSLEYMAFFHSFSIQFWSIWEW